MLGFIDFVVSILSQVDKQSPLLCLFISYIENRHYKNQLDFQRSHFKDNYRQRCCTTPRNKKARDTKPRANSKSKPKSILNIHLNKRNIACVVSHTAENKLHNVARFQRCICSVSESSVSELGKVT